MNKLVPTGLGAAAVVVALVVGVQVLGLTGGGGGSPSIEPSPSPSVAPSPTPTPEGGLPEGPFVIVDGPFDFGDSGLAITVTISAQDWYGEPGGGILGKNENTDPPDGSAVIVFAGGNGWHVPGDPCDWDSTMPETPSTTVDQLVAALAAQGSRDASTPADITLDGYAGKSITLHVPDDAVFATCHEAKFCTLALPGPDPARDCYRYSQGPGQVDNLWIVDVNGQLVIFDWNGFEATPEGDLAELQAIVESATFEAR